jgi:hypothetical protein
MRRRKRRERRHTWLQRELEASGLVLNDRPARRLVLPPSTTTFDLIAVRPTAPANRHRPPAREVPAYSN